MKLLNLKIKNILANVNQPRKNFNEKKLEELKESIKNNGLIQPIIVRKIDIGKNKGKYEIIAGERRFRAVKMLNMEEIQAIVINAGDGKTYEYGVLENIQRENLNAIEEGEAYLMLINVYNYSQEELAKKLGKTRSAIANKIRLLKLPEEVKEQIKNDELSYGQARTLLSLNDDEKIVKMAKKVVEKNISVRELEKIVKQKNEKKLVKTEKNYEKIEENDRSENNFEKNDGEKQFLEEKLRQFFDTKVEIKGNIMENGKIEINFFSYEELERIIEIIGLEFE